MSHKSAVIITILLGAFGVHRFMSGKIGTGILWLCTAGCFGIGWIVDVVKVCNRSFTKKDGTPWVVD